MATTGRGWQLQHDDGDQGGDGEQARGGDDDQAGDRNRDGPGDGRHVVGSEPGTRSG